MCFFTMIETSLNNRTEGSVACFPYKFYELLAYLKGQTGINLQDTYRKNVDLLRESLKIEKKVPELDRLENLFKEIFLTK